MKKSLNISQTVLWPLFLLTAVFIIELLFSYTTSPLYDVIGTDSGIFQTVGYGLLNGKIPYRDLFDQKGPMLWFIQAAGLAISKSWGIFLLQLVWLTASAAIWYRIARTILPAIKARTAVALNVIPFLLFSHGGNQCEEWMLPFISLSYLVALKQLLGNKSGIRAAAIYGVIYGLCFGIVFFLRVNDALGQCGGVILGIFIWHLANRRFASAAIHALTALCAAGITAVPIIAFYYSNGAMSELIYGMFTFSMKYSSGVKGFVLRIFSTHKIVYGLAPVIVCVWLSFVRYRRSLFFVLMPASLLAYAALGPMTGARYPVLAMLPLICIASALILQCPRSMMSESVCFMVLAQMFAGYILMLYIPFRDLRHLWLTPGKKELYHAFYTETDRLLDNIPSDERNSIWNLNLEYNSPNGTFSDPCPTYNDILFHKGMVQCNRMLMQAQAALYDRDLARRDEEMFDSVRPLWILTDYSAEAFQLCGGIEQAISRDYRVVAETDTSIACIRLYRRIE